MELKVKCDKCTEQFMLNSETIKERNITIAQEKLVLTYYACPKCGKEYDVMVDNEKSKGYLARLTTELSTAAKAKNRGHSIAFGKVSSKVSNLRRLLSVERNKLVKDHNDEKYVDDAGHVGSFHINLKKSDEPAFKMK